MINNFDVFLSSLPHFGICVFDKVISKRIEIFHSIELTKTKKVVDKHFGSIKQLTVIINVALIVTALGTSSSSTQKLCY